MTSNKKILSILGFLGILVGLLLINMFFLKVSKSIAELSKGSSLNKNQPIAINSQEQNEIIEISNLGKNGKEIISNLAFYLEHNKENKIKNFEANNQEAFKTSNFLQIDSQEVNFKEINNHTIVERYPDFPSVELNPPGKSKNNPAHIPIIDRNSAGAEVNEDRKTLMQGNSTSIVNNGLNNTDTGSVICEDKITSIDVLSESVNSTIVKISENRTNVIDLPKEKHNNYTAACTDTNKIPTQEKSTNTTEHHKKTNITRQETIIIVEKNHTDKAHKNASETSNQKNKQNITIVNNTYKANGTITDDDESCDYESEEDQDVNKTATAGYMPSNGNLRTDSHNHKQANKEHDSKDQYYNKHQKAHNKHHTKDKNHEKKCRNKKHAHYIQLLENDNTNLNQETEALLDKISPQIKIVESANGSSYTQAALSKMIVVDHIQAPKAEKAKKEMLIEDEAKINLNDLQAEKPIENAASSTENKSINNVDIKKIIRSNKNQENSSKRISLIASILSLFVFGGICLLGVEIYKNHQKANIIVFDQNEHIEMEKKYDYILLDSDLETQNSTREIGIQEI